MIGRTLGHYKITDKLGAGGMGEVYLAEDMRLGRKVALKILPPEMASDPERLRRFEREVKAIASLNHPNVVTLHSVEEIEGVLFFTMEAVEGRTLSELIPSDGFSRDEFLRLATPLVSAVAAAHDRHITHRDLKPTNVMVDANGRVKVLDFGLAKKSPPRRPEELSTEILTEFGRILGTGPYMSPEQVQGLPADFRSDVFSLGILLYEMATGRRPFVGKSEAQVLYSILKDTPLHLQDGDTSLPPRLRSILARCLEKNPKDRFESAGELEEHLRHYEQEAELRNIVTPARKPSRRTLLLSIVLLVILVAASAVYLHLSRPDAPPSAPVPAAQTAQSRPSLAILRFQNLNNRAELDWLSMGLADMMTTDLSNIPEIDVLSTGEVYRALKALSDAGSSELDQDIVRQIADKTGATMVLIGNFAKMGEAIQVDIKLRDATDGGILAADRREGLGDESIFTLVDELSWAIRQQLAGVGVADSRGKGRGIRDITTSSVEALRYYLEANELHVQSKDQEALPLLEKAVEADPDFALALSTLSVLHGNFGREKQALAYAQRAVRNADRLPESQRYFVKGEYYARQWKTYGLALEAFRKAVELYPGDDPSRSHLGHLYAWLDNYHEAAEQFEELVRRNNLYAGNHYMLAQVYGSLDDFSRGHEVLEALIKRRPKDWYLRMGLGWHMVHWERYDAARAAFAEADALRSGELLTINGRWRLHVMADEWEEAEEEAKEIMAFHDLHSTWRGHICLARTHLYRGRYQEAMKVFAEGAKVYPDPDAFTAITHCWAGESYLAFGEYERALEEAKKAQEFGIYEWPERQGLFLAAQAEAKLGDFEAARASQQKLKDLSGESPNRVEERQDVILEGLLALEEGDLETALARLHEAEALLPPRGIASHWHVLADHLPLWYALAHAEHAAGNLDRAAEYYERITRGTVEHIEFPIPYVRSFYLLAQVYEEQGQSEKAREPYRRFVDYWGDGDADRERVEEARRKSQVPH